MQIFQKTNGLVILVAIGLLTSCGTKSISDSDLKKSKFALNDGAGGKAYLTSSKSDDENPIKYEDLQIVFRGKLYRIAPSSYLEKYAAKTCAYFKPTPRPVIATEQKNLLESVVKVDAEGTVSEAPKEDRIIINFTCLK